MRSVAFVAGLRLRRRVPAVIVAGLLLGVGFGVCFASVAAARAPTLRTTASSLPRTPPTLAIAHGTDVGP